MMDNEEQKNPNWERDLVNRLTFAAVNEQRRARRWSIFFRSLMLIWLFSLIIIIYPSSKEPFSKVTGPHTALVEIDGVIAANTVANADNIITALRSAFDNKQSKAVILRINSPGGSPVQSGYVNDEIIRLRNKYPKKKLYAVITDICASGGYYIASAADEIFADKASIVGSIGVLMNGFGYVDTMRKLGVERRLITAGKHKGFLDPFSPQKEEDVKHIQVMLDAIHKQFIDTVKNGRGNRLADNDELFSGYAWTGEKSVELGLVDGLGSSSYVAREIVGADRIIDYTVRPNYLDRFAERLGVAMANVLVTTLGIQGSLIK